ncbi:hypothetical protein LFWB_0740 [Candidatus Phytoplasma luffae]|uniref:Uncharacterized protein n=1 Tax=Loofah witches'-broom phytoplasma TaxID=35773 RepID=A0A975IM11_LOWBP|nr:hypothetical protein [Candidatus Phytoplasma luffae]QTX02644.1 hypothetical protein LFWB_0740 [Candidatus Phytoplasma luffae]
MITAIIGLYFVGFMFRAQIAKKYHELFPNRNTQIEQTQTISDLAMFQKRFEIIKKRINDQSKLLQLNNLEVDVETSQSKLSIEHPDSIGFEELINDIQTAIKDLTTILNPPIATPTTPNITQETKTLTSNEFQRRYDKLTTDFENKKSAIQ